MRALILRHDGMASRIEQVADTLDDPEAYLELADIPVPDPGPGQVLIQVRRSTVNPSDVAYVRGFYGQARVQGQAAGFEGVGRVVKAGPGLMGRFLKGRDVAFYVTPDGTGAWADYAVTRADAALPLKKGVSDRDGAAMLVNPVTAAAMLDLVAPGQAFVFSAAASQLGKLMAGLARDQGKRMIAILRRDAPMKTLTDLGAAVVLNDTAPGFPDALAQTLKTEQPQIFLDAVSGGTSPLIFKSMGHHARWVVYGKLDNAPAEILEPGELIFLQKRIEGFWAAAWSARTPMLRKLRVSNQVQSRFRSGQWRTDVSAELPLGSALQDLAQALHQRDGKTQIVTGAT